MGKRKQQLKCRVGKTEETNQVSKLAEALENLNNALMNDANIIVKHF